MCFKVRAIEIRRSEQQFQVLEELKYLLEEVIVTVTNSSRNDGETSNYPEFSKGLGEYMRIVS